MQVAADSSKACFGSDDLRLPEAIRAPLLAHIEQLRERYRQRGWGGRVGFGKRPAVAVMDLPGSGSNRGSRSAAI